MQAIERKRVCEKTNRRPRGEQEIRKPGQEERKIMKKIIMFEGDIETQGYFSRQMQKQFEADGYEVLMYNFEKEGSSLSRLMRFAEKGNTAMVSFNFHGLTDSEFMRDKDGGWFWDDLEIPCFNIVVDHPFYYHKFLKIVPEHYVHISIDYNHDLYMARFFPEIKRGPVLPLAGTRLPEEEQIPFARRSMDICFTGNYTPPDSFEPYIQRQGQEYADFYHGILDDLIAHTDRTLEDVCEEHIKREIPDISFEDLKETFPNLIFLDLYIRFYYRGMVIRNLVDGGLKVHVFGDDWSRLSCKHPENLIDHKPTDSYGCLKSIADSKLSVNVMPWFKNGAHDRIFNSMANGAVCVTDSSTFLDNLLIDGSNCLRYNLNDVDALWERTGGLLSHPDKMEEIAQNGYRMTMEGQTWAHRSRFIQRLIEEYGKEGVSCQ